MKLYALRAQKFEARTLSAKVSYRFFLVLIAGYVVAEVSFHVLKGKCLLHLNF